MALARTHTACRCTRACCDIYNAEAFPRHQIDYVVKLLVAFALVHRVEKKGRLRAGGLSYSPDPNTTILWYILCLIFWAYFFFFLAIMVLLQFI